MVGIGFLQWLSLSGIVWFKRVSQASGSARAKRTTMACVAGCNSQGNPCVVIGRWTSGPLGRVRAKKALKPHFCIACVGLLVTDRFEA